MAYQIYDGKCYCPAYTVTINSVPAVTSADWYYHVTEFLPHLETQCAAALAGIWINHSTTTSKITIGKSGANFSLAWTGTTLRNNLGFTGDLSGNNSYTGTYPIRYVWLPSKQMARYPADPNNIWTPESNTKYIRSKSGKTYSIKNYELYRAMIEFNFLDTTEIYRTYGIGADGDYNRLENFFDDVLHAGAPFAFYPDSSTSNYDECMLFTDGESVGDMENYCGRTVPFYDTYWDVQLPMMKYL